MLDHPVTQKVLTTVVAAGILATSGVAWNTRQLAEKHEHDIISLKENDAATKTQIAEGLSGMTGELREIRKDVGEIKTDVAVVKERTEVYAKNGVTRR